MEFGQKTSILVKHGHNLERVQSSQGTEMAIGGIGGGQSIVAGQPTSSVASVTAPSEGGCMQSVPMSSSLVAPAGWAPLPHFTRAPAHMGSPPSKVKIFPHLTPCLLHRILRHGIPCFGCPGGQLAADSFLFKHSFTQHTCSQPMVHSGKRSARPQDVGEARRTTQSKQCLTG